MVNMEWQTIFYVFLSTGILLICAEVFLPGGILGSIGAVALIAAMLLSFKAFQEAAIFVSLGIIALLGASLVLFVKFFPRSSIGKRMTLSNDSKEFRASQGGLDELVGKEGEARSDLRPAGFANIEGQRVDVVTEGQMIDKGERVRVAKVEGNRVVVRPV
jgi:membrane-bound serine protease (ClpP class)